ncbi:Transcriptional regulator, MecI family [Microbacterium esteraromaticum]|uniref:Transcriptional regulator, MecI family n=1 Tax=Microbacterium esteraromaticum TaxID=57043 RepID=A0A1R4KF08_9MICO|nr:BlaI/MecI/CopY family transcriptional regulator [Microbacterium esteraromaticum]SJN42910.1 Transcriptional regulator, MecI family [Microbacterium esteraromaticum]
MGTLGELERAVMNAIWATDAAVTAYDVKDALEADGRVLAVTTVLTVLSRLEKKGFVSSDRSSRPHRYTAVASRADHVAELMHEVLGAAGDRTAVLERFVGGVSDEDAAVLRTLLRRAV